MPELDGEHILVSHDEARLVVRFTVLGEAQPAGSKSSFVPMNRATGQPYRGESGRVIVNTVDSNPKSKDWKKRVAIVAQEAMQEANKNPVDGPLKVIFKFMRLRPKGHWGSGRNSHVLKQTAPRYPITKPDVLKLARGTEDAMTGIVYRDDSQIVSEVIEKNYSYQSGVEIEVWSL